MSQSCTPSKCYASRPRTIPTASRLFLKCRVAAVKSSVVSVLSFFGAKAM